MDEMENNQIFQDENGDPVAAENTDIEEELPAVKKDGGSVLLSVFAGVLGTFIALLLISVCCGVTGGIRYFPFILIPLCICFANVILKGDKSVPGIICNIIFTALGIFLVPAFFSAVQYCLKQGTTLITLPLVALGRVTENNFFTDISFSSHTVFPIIFAIIGVAVSWQIGKYYRNK